MAQQVGTCTTTNADTLTLTSGAGNNFGDGPACQTVASVNVGQVITIADNTPAISFPGVAGETSAPGSTPVSITVYSNDPASYEVSVLAFGTPTSAGGTSGNGCSFDASGQTTGTPIPFSGLTVLPNGGAAVSAMYEFSGGSTGTGCGGSVSAIYEEPAHSGPSGPSGDTYSDIWQLSIPAGTAPGNYYASLQYQVLGA